MSDILKFNYNFKKRQNYKILKSLNKENVTKLFFYTHYQNLLKILEYGIQISSQLQINEGESYEIWSYCERENDILLEYEDSSRYYFWRWVSRNKVAVDDIATVCLDLKLLYGTCENNWEIDREKKNLIIHEKINPATIKWILAKQIDNKALLQNYITRKKLAIHLYVGKADRVEQIENEN